MEPLLTYATPSRRLVADALTTGVEPVRRAMLATADSIDAVAASADAALTPAIHRYGSVHSAYSCPSLCFLSGCDMKAPADCTRVAVAEVWWSV